MKQEQPAPPRVMGFTDTAIATADHNRNLSRYVYKFGLINHPASIHNKPVQSQIIIKGLANTHTGVDSKVTDNAAEQLSSPMYVYL